MNPVTAAIVKAIALAHCRHTLELHRERLSHFKRRIAEQGLNPRDILIMILNVDDPAGGVVTEILMPNNGAAWAAMRAQGQVPYARGLAERAGFEAGLQRHDPAAAADLAQLEQAIVVMDHGVIAVFSADI